MYSSFWILGAIVRCLCFGIEIFSACCCLCASCCSCCAPKRRQQQQPEYYGRNAPPMPMGPPSYQQQPVVVHNHFDRSLNDDEYGSGGPGYRGFSGNLPLTRLRLLGSVITQMEQLKSPQSLHHLFLLPPQSDSSVLIAADTANWRILSSTGTLETVIMLLK